MGEFPRTGINGGPDNGERVAMLSRAGYFPWNYWRPGRGAGAEIPQSMPGHGHLPAEREQGLLGHLFGHIGHPKKGKRLGAEEDGSKIREELSEIAGIAVPKNK